MEKIMKKSFTNPDETRIFPKGKLELVSAGGITFARATFEPGWSWSESVKPLAKTEWCLVPHKQYHISGRLHVQMEDGTEEEFGPGDVSILPPGHNGWVVGDEPVVVIDVSSMEDYAKEA